MTTLLLLILASLLAHAELAPSLHHLKECQSQAGIALVFNSDRYVTSWLESADKHARVSSGFRDRCDKIKKMFPGQPIRISTLMVDRKAQIQDAKNIQAKQQGVVDYISSLRKDMQKYGGAESKACVLRLLDLENSLPKLGAALEADAKKICED